MQIFDLQFVEFKAFLRCDQILHFILLLLCFLILFIWWWWPLWGRLMLKQVRGLCVWDFVFLKISQEENDKKNDKKKKKKISQELHP